MCGSSMLQHVAIHTDCLSTTAHSTECMKSIAQPSWILQLLCNNTDTRHRFPNPSGAQLQALLSGTHHASSTCACLPHSSLANHLGSSRRQNRPHIVRTCCNNRGGLKRRYNIVRSALHVAHVRQADICATCGNCCSACSLATASAFVEMTKICIPAGSGCSCLANTPVCPGILESAVPLATPLPCQATAVPTPAAELPLPLP